MIRKHSLTDDGLVSLCLLKLRQDPRHYQPVEILTEQMKLKDVDARIIFWKSVIEFGGDENTFAVDQFTKAVDEKSNTGDAVTFWEGLVGIFPYSRSISFAMHHAFEVHGDHTYSIQFWEDITKIYPKECHFAHCLTMCLNSSGVLERGITLEKMVRIFFKRRYDST